MLNIFMLNGMGGLASPTGGGKYFLRVRFEINVAVAMISFDALPKGDAMPAPAPVFSR